MLFTISHIILINNNFQKHKHVKSNEIVFRRFGNIMMPI